MLDSLQYRNDSLLLFLNGKIWNGECFEGVYAEQGEDESPTARGDSSSRGLCIFHTGAGDVLCSGLTRPTHLVSPEASESKKSMH